MAFEQVRIARFRNIDEAELRLGAGHIFLLGENGQGKTNFLEALYCLSYGTSFRTHQDRELLRHGDDEFLLRASWKEMDSPIEEQISLKYAREGRKELRLNEKLLSDRKELVAHNPAVVFCHEDMAFAAGIPEERRFFFDQCAGMLWIEYIDLLRFYRRVLKHRNMILKTDNTFRILDTLDEQLAHYGCEIMVLRKRLSLLFARRFPEYYERVSQLGTEVSIQYMPSWPEGASAEEIVELLAQQRQRDIDAATSLSGPHRDRWAFTHEGRNFHPLPPQASSGLPHSYCALYRFICMQSSRMGAYRGFLCFCWMMFFWSSMWPRGADFFRSYQGGAPVHRPCLLFCRKSHGANMQMRLQ